MLIRINFQGTKFIENSMFFSVFCPKIMEVSPFIVEL
jgi:hypothetical protein